MSKKNQTIKLKVAMLERDIRQRDIVKALDYTPAFVSMVLSGRRPPPKKFRAWIKENLGEVA